MQQIVTFAYVPAILYDFLNSVVSYHSKKYDKSWQGKHQHFKLY